MLGLELNFLCALERVRCGLSSKCISHEGLREWTRASRRTLTHLLALSRWLLESLHVASILCATSIVKQAPLKRDAGLTLAKDMLYLLHSKQYSSSTRAIHTAGVDLMLDYRNLEPDDMQTLFFKMASRVTSAELRRHARNSLVKTMPGSNAVARGSLRDTVVFLAAAGEIIVVASMIVVTSRVQWKMNATLSFSKGDSLHSGPVHVRRLIPLHSLVDNIFQAARASALGTFCTVAADLASSCSGSMVAECFNGTMFLRSLPRVNLEGVRSVVAIVDFVIGRNAIFHVTVVVQPRQIFASFPVSTPGGNSRRLDAAHFLLCLGISQLTIESCSLRPTAHAAPSSRDKQNPAALSLGPARFPRRVHEKPNGAQFATWRPP